MTPPRKSPGAPVKPKPTYPARMTADTVAKVIAAEKSNVSEMATRLEISRRYLTEVLVGSKPVKRWLQLALTSIYRRIEPLE
jgi:ActR/RegA family two-component response regulator